MNQSLKVFAACGGNQKTLPKTDIFMPALNIQEGESFTKIELFLFSSQANCAETKKVGDGELFIGKGIKNGDRNGRYF